MLLLAVDVHTYSFLGGPVMLRLSECLWGTILNSSSGAIFCDRKTMVFIHSFP